MKKIKYKNFNNGAVYALQTEDGFPVEVTDSFLPYYTKNCINEHENTLKDYHVGTRKDRWMIGLSCQSGCPVHCKFCATGQLKRFKNLTAEEIYQQFKFIIDKNPKYKFDEAKEYKINYTRMGEPFLNIDAVRGAIELIEKDYPNTHHYISTIGIKDADFSWIKDNITLQISLHSLIEEKRNELIPYRNKMTIEELGKIRTKSNLKTTVNLTLVNEDDFDIELLHKYFDPNYFFIKLSPINVNDVSIANEMGNGFIESENLL